MFYGKSVLFVFHVPYNRRVLSPDGEAMSDAEPDHDEDDREQTHDDADAVERHLRLRYDLPLLSGDKAQSWSASMAIWMMQAVPIFSLKVTTPK